ncbi:uncharacterized protein LOC108681611 [Hyalella azteca]|uniref:Uncharacterized protein LOC108681611 n=1 Tax=Hyalella azteca TaxID=294128 RepID=A0A979FNC3_HYAAZ|nr:uncharacterized protein LOC108681611 [Hyalella azteca]
MLWPEKTPALHGAARLLLLVAYLAGSARGQCNGRALVIGPSNFTSHLAFPPANWDSALARWTNLLLYPTSVTCQWVIRAPHQHVIHAKFLKFDTERNYDFVHIYGSEDGRSQELLGVSGDLPRTPWQVVTPGRVMTVVFTSDEHTAYHGFLLAHHYVPAACVPPGAHVVEEQLIALPPWNLQGILPGPLTPEEPPPPLPNMAVTSMGALPLMSGGVPRGYWMELASYQPQMNCTWYVVVQPRYIVQLHVVAFSTDPMDQLTVTRFDQSGAQRLIQHGGSEGFPWPLIQSAHPLMLGFTSRGVEDGSRGGAGFLINVTYVNRACNPAIQELVDPAGLLGYPSYNLVDGTWRTEGHIPYGPDHCRWRIYAPHGYVINVTVFVLDTYDSDVLKAVESDWSTLFELSGALETGPQSFISVTGDVELEFASSHSSQHTGFMLQYQWLLQDCTHELRTPHGVIQSPYLPLAYGASVHCTWSLHQPYQHAVHLLIRQYSLDRGDVLQVMSAGEIVYQLSADQRPVSRLLELQASSEVSVVFSSDETDNEGGFELQYVVFREGSCNFTLTPCGYTPAAPDTPWLFDAAGGHMIMTEGDEKGPMLPRGYRAQLRSPPISPTQGQLPAVSESSQKTDHAMCISLVFTLDGPDAYQLSVIIKSLQQEKPKSHQNSQSHFTTNRRSKRDLNSHFRSVNFPTRYYEKEFQDDVERKEEEILVYDSYDAKGDYDSRVFDHNSKADHFLPDPVNLVTNNVNMVMNRTSPFAIDSAKFVYDARSPRHLTEKKVSRMSRFRRRAYMERSHYQTFSEGVEESGSTVILVQGPHGAGAIRRVANFTAEGSFEVFIQYERGYGPLYLVQIHQVDIKDGPCGQDLDHHQDFNCDFAATSHPITPGSSSHTTGQQMGPEIGSQNLRKTLENGREVEDVADTQGNIGSRDKIQGRTKSKAREENIDENFEDHGKFEQESMCGWTNTLVDQFNWFLTEKGMIATSPLTEGSQARRKNTQVERNSDLISPPLNTSRIFGIHSWDSLFKSDMETHKSFNATKERSKTPEFADRESHFLNQNVDSFNSSLSAKELCMFFTYEILSPSADLQVLIRSPNGINAPGNNRAKAAYPFDFTSKLDMYENSPGVSTFSLFSEEEAINELPLSDGLKANRNSEPVVNREEFLLWSHGRVISPKPLNAFLSLPSSLVSDYSQIIFRARDFTGEHSTPNSNSRQHSPSNDGGETLFTRIQSNEGIIVKNVRLAVRTQCVAQVPHVSTNDDAAKSLRINMHEEDQDHSLRNHLFGTEEDGKYPSLSREMYGSARELSGIQDLSFGSALKEDNPRATPSLGTDRFFEEDPNGSVVDCNFDDGFCNWRLHHSGNVVWAILGRGDGSQKYHAGVVTLPGIAGAADLVSAVLPPGPARVLSFRYLLADTDQCLEVAVVADIGGNVSAESQPKQDTGNSGPALQEALQVLWQQCRSKGSSWLTECVQVPATRTRMQVRGRSAAELSAKIRKKNAAYECPDNGFLCRSDVRCSADICPEAAVAGACLARPLLCNGVADCAAGEDEAFCADLHRTASSSQTMSTKLQDGASFSNIKNPSDLRSGNGFVVPRRDHLDGRTHPHAKTNTDKINSVQKNYERNGILSNADEDGSATFRCGDGLVVPATWLCDGRKDCPSDGLDETGCLHCHENEFVCPVSGVCVPQSGVCDGVMTVPDCTDETHCFACPPGTYVCDKCIQSWQICDGNFDCLNGEDERKCGDINYSPSAGQNHVPLHSANNGVLFPGEQDQNIAQASSANQNSRLVLPSDPRESSSGYSSDENLSHSDHKRPPSPPLDKAVVDGSVKRPGNESAPPTQLLSDQDSRQHPEDPFAGVLGQHGRKSPTLLRQSPSQPSGYYQPPPGSQRVPSSYPSPNNPSLNPSLNPLLNPSLNPSFDSSLNSLQNPAQNPSTNTSQKPSQNPSLSPSLNPSYNDSLNSLSSLHYRPKIPNVFSATNLDSTNYNENIFVPSDLDPEDPNNPNHHSYPDVYAPQNQKNSILNHDQYSYDPKNLALNRYEPPNSVKNPMNFVSDDDCRPDEYSCAMTRSCIVASAVCDREEDCLLGDDEHDCPDDNLQGTSGHRTSGFIFADSLFGESGDFADLAVQESADEVNIMSIKLTLHVIFFRFYKFLFGAHVNRLSVLLRQTVAGHGVHETVLYSTVGSKGLSWLSSRISIDPEHLVDPSAPFVIVVRATRGAGSEGDIALDSLSFTPGGCHPTEYYSVNSSFPSKSPGPGPARATGDQRRNNLQEFPLEQFVFDVFLKPLFHEGSRALKSGAATVPLPMPTPEVQLITITSLSPPHHLTIAPSSPRPPQAADAHNTSQAAADAHNASQEGGDACAWLTACSDYIA